MEPGFHLVEESHSHQIRFREDVRSDDCHHHHPQSFRERLATTVAYQKFSMAGQVVPTAVRGW